MEEYLKDYPQWFFVWTTGKPYITTICAWTKKGAIREVVESSLGLTWKQIYRRGGRIKKFTLKEQP